MDPVNPNEAKAAPHATALTRSLDDADRSSSFLALLHWWRGAHPHEPLAVVALEPGPTPGGTRALAPTTVVHDPQGWTIPRIAQRLRLRRVSGALTSWALRRRLRIHHPVYLPDASGARLLHWLPDDAGPVTTHLPAPSSGLDGLTPTDRSALLERTDRWIVGAGHHRGALLAAGVDAGSITELEDVLGSDEVDLPDRVATAVEATRRELRADQAIGEDAPLVVGVGAADWWLQPDAFVRVCWEVVRRGDEGIHLCWIADGASERMLWPLRHDIAHAGLDHRVHIITGARPSWEYVAAADVVVDTRLASASPPALTGAHRFARCVITFAPREQTAGTDEGSAIRHVTHLECTTMAEAVLDALRSPEPPGRAYQRLPADDPRRPEVGGPSVRSVILGR